MIADDGVEVHCLVAQDAEGNIKETIAGPIDRAMVDQMIEEKSVRIYHRVGKGLQIWWGSTRLEV